MAVEGMVFKNIPFPVGKSSVAPTTILDHVSRILNDHDYTKTTVPERKKYGDTPKGKRSIDLVNINAKQGDFEILGCDYPSPKDKNEDQLPKEGIEASDMSSLLEQFLEYEQELDINQSASLLTPATSPGRCETWNELALITDSHKSAIELTPPSTPPVLELHEQKIVHMDCDISPKKHSKTKDEKLTDESQVVNTTFERSLDNCEVRYSGELSCAETKKAESHSKLKECLTSDSNKDNNDTLETKVIRDEDCVGKLHDNEHKGDVLSKEKSDSGKTDKILPCDVNECDEQVDRSMSDGEISSDKMSGKRKNDVSGENSMETSACDHDRKKYSRRKAENDDVEHTRFKKCVHEEGRQDRKRTRWRYKDDECSGDERYDPRRCEKSNKRCREFSKHFDERHRRHTREYDQNSNRKHHGDKRKNYTRHSTDKKYCEKVRDVEHERKIDFRLGRSTAKDVAKEERRVVYVGGLPYGTTQDELWERLRRFGPVEKVTVHLREGERDNYGFATFFEPEDARQCIECGNSDPKESKLDFCFGGRRQYCGGSYVDFDSKTSCIEELNETFGNVGGETPEEDDFDSLLRRYQDELRSKNP